MFLGPLSIWEHANLAEPVRAVSDGPQRGEDPILGEPRALRDEPLRHLPRDSL